MVEDANKVSGAMGQASRESEGWENVMGNMKQAWTDFQAIIGVPLLEVATDVLLELTDKMQSFDAQVIADRIQQAIDKFIEFKNAAVPVVQAILDKFSEFKTAATPVVQEIIEKVKEFATMIQENWVPIREVLISLGAAFVTLKVAMGILTLINVVKGAWLAYKTSAFAAMVAQQGLNAALLMNPIGLVVAAIVALVAIGVLLWRNWDTVKEKAGQLWAFLTEKFTAIKDVIIEKVSSAISGAVTFFSELPGKIAYWLGYTISKTIGFLSTLPGTFKKWFGNARDEASNTVAELPGKIASFLAEIPGKAAGVIRDVTAKFKELGRAIPNAIAAGFNAAKDALGGAAKWALDKVIGGFDSLKNLGVNVVSNFTRGAVDGSHYHGLDRIPYNGYTAKLHKNEQILSADEAKAYRSGKTGGGITINMNGVTIREEADVDKLANRLAAKIFEAGEQGA